MYYLHKKIFVLFFAVVSFCLSQNIARIEVKLDKPAQVYVPAYINLSEIGDFKKDQILLYRHKKDQKLPVAFQIEKNGKELYWLLDADSSSAYNFELVETANPHKQPNLHLKKEDGLLIISSGNRKLLGYQYQTKYPPAGVDSAFQRSGFIHPLWSPNGQVLTRIQPADHYHHYGIWNPWTHVLFEKDTVDFWNLGKKQGTVRHAKFKSLTEGDIFAEFQAVHEHVAFHKDGPEKVAINELQTVRVYQPRDNYYLVDLTIDLECASDSPVKLLAYRYGGFGWRATEQWNPANSELLSSQGKNRIEVDNTRGDWFYFQGEVDSDYAGILMMSYPTNFDHPQPMRIWSDPNETRGLFASFSPTREKDWLLEPGKVYTQRYRFIVYNGHYNFGKAKNAWQFYKEPPKINVSKNQ